MRTFLILLPFVIGTAMPSQSASAQTFTLFDHRMGQMEEPGATTSGAVGFDRKATALATDRSFREALYEPLIRQAEARYRLPPRLFHALVWAESRFDPLAISPAGAAGLAQLMPGTARDLGVTNRQDPQQNINGGARYLRQMLDRFGAVHLALAAYNAGPNAVARAGGIPRNRETASYVSSVIAKWMAYSS